MVRAGGVEQGPILKTFFVVPVVVHVYKTSGGGIYVI